MKIRVDSYLDDKCCIWFEKQIFPTSKTNRTCQSYIMPFAKLSTNDHLETKISSYPTMGLLRWFTDGRAKQSAALTAHA
jgi:hypothetical protein